MALLKDDPSIHRNAAGRFLLFHIGCGASPRTCPACVRGCSNGTTPPGGTAARARSPPHRGGTGGGGGGGGCNGPHWTGLRTSDSLDGPWRDEGEVLLTTPKRQKWITNPCVIPAGSKSDNTTTAYLLYRQASGAFPGASGGGERLGWATASQCPTTINCSYVDHSTAAPLLDCNLEDQFLWRDRRGNLHALTHKNCAGTGVSGHMWSGDGGATWATSPVPPYNNTIAFRDGGVHQCGKRARPMLLVEGGRPRYLSTGATYEAHSDHTFTTMQEVGGEW